MGRAHRLSADPTTHSDRFGRLFGERRGAEWPRPGAVACQVDGPGVHLLVEDARAALMEMPVALRGTFPAGGGGELVLAAKLCQRDSQQTMDIFGRTPDTFRVRFPDPVALQAFLNGR